MLARRNRSLTPVVLLAAAALTACSATASKIMVASIQQKFFPELTDGEFIKPMMAAQSAVASPSAS